MKTAQQLPILSVILALTLSACASADERYPSLDIRPTERSLGTLNPEKPGGDSTAPATDLRLIQSALDRALAANANFAVQETEARKLMAVARGRDRESDDRARALVAVAGLTSLRGQTAIALADLDALEVKAATEFSETNAIHTAQASVVRLITAQDATLDSLSEVMAR